MEGISSLAAGGIIKAGIKGLKSILKKNIDKTNSIKKEIPRVLDEAVETKQTIFYKILFQKLYKKHLLN